jgi:hypothetical protein
MFGSAMYQLKDYFVSCCESAEKLVPGYDVSAEKAHVAAMFDQWIRAYELKDEYPVDESLDTVYRRNFVGPIQQLSDYAALGYGKVLEDFMKGIGNNPFAVMRIQDALINAIDGKKTVGEIIRSISLQKRTDVKDKVLKMLQLLKDINLISEV